MIRFDDDSGCLASGWPMLAPGRTRHLLTMVHPRASGPLLLAPTRRRPLEIGLAASFGVGPAEHRILVEPDPAVGRLRLTTMGSDALFVDGVLRTRATLSSGAVLRLGDTLMVYRTVIEPLIDVGRPPCGTSFPLHLAQRLVERAAHAPIEWPILVRGPSGTGKEHLARRVHEASGRPGAFIAVNCAGLAGPLLAAELFGHARGAFTGAVGERPGLFRAAHRGTLFLDEIGDLPLDVQPMLLRALQERNVRPLGSEVEVPVDVRVVCATHRNLEASVAEGRFRADLLSRLDALAVDLAGLAGRREDVLPLLLGFLGEDVRFDTDAAEALLSTEWPDNVRSLRQFANWVLHATDATGVLGVEDLPPALRLEALERLDARRVEVPDESVHLAALLERHRGRVADVARAAGLTRQQAYRRFQRYGLDPDRFR
jgi:DNA-binding NtrC family response regulator